MKQIQGAAARTAPTGNRGFPCRSTAAPYLLEPAHKDGLAGFRHVDELDSHAHTRFYNSNHCKGFHDLLAPRVRNARSRPRGQAFARADKAAAQRKVGGDALDARARFEVEEHDVRGEGIADSVPAVAHRRCAKPGLANVLVHQDYVDHRFWARSSAGAAPWRAPVLSVCPNSSRLQSLCSAVSAKTTIPFPP